jgi:hypothetical protein
MLVFYSALIFVCNAYSYDTRIRMIRAAFIWYAYSYDTRVRRWYAYSDIRLIMICVWYTYHTGIVCYNIRERYFTFWDLSYFCLKNEYNEDNFNGRMQCSERRKWNFLASNFKNFPRGHAPGSPSYARSLKMLRSDFWLDPPLPGTMASKRAKVDFLSETIFKE